MGSSASVAVARYLFGITALLATFGALGFASLLIRRRYLADWTGAVARLVEVVILLGLLTAILEVLGTIGLFSLVPIVVASLLLAAAAARAFGIPRIADRPRVRSAIGIATVVALAAVAATAGEWAGPTLESYDVGIRTFDSLWYHLPWAASFAQTGQITSLRFTDVEYLTPFYPATAEMLHGLGIVLLSRDTISPGVNLLWLGLVLLAAYCVGRPRGIGAQTMAGATLAMATPMVRFSQAGSAANDVVGIFFVLAAVALLVNANGRRFPLAIAAVAAGLAVAVKLSMLAPVLALTIGVLAISPSRNRRTDAALWLGPLLLAGGFWYLRNLIAVGNPLPWLNVPGLATPAQPLQAHTGFSVLHYLTNGHVLSGVVEPGLASGLGPWWALIVALAVAGPILCLLPVRNCEQNCRQSARLVRMLGFVALASLAAYLITPETAAGPAGNPLGFAFNLRYAAPGLALSLTVLPLSPALRGERRRDRGAGRPRDRAGRDRGAGAAVAVTPPAWCACAGRRLAACRGRSRRGAAATPCARARAGGWIGAGRSGRWLCPTAPLPARPLCVSSRRLAACARVGILPRRARSPGWDRRYVWRLLLVPALRAG